MHSSSYPFPLLSVIIPTRNRFKYVISAIKSVLSIDNVRLELVVQDNSDNSDLSNWVNENINDKRLKYNYDNSPLSFVGNFNTAVSLASGKYVCLIGDDDGINSEIVNIVEWMSSVNIDSLSTTISANFVWENSGVPATKFTKVTGGVLSLSSTNFKIFRTDLKKQLNLFFENGCYNYLEFGLPKLYQGIVKKECLEKVKEISGSYFGGLSPDIYASISLSLIASKVFVTNYPLIISGVCGESASIIEGLLKKNSKKLEDAPHFRNRGEYEWSYLVPKVYTVETIWADSAIAAIKAMKSEELINKFNIAKLSAFCILNNSGIDSQVYQNLSTALSFLKKNMTVGYFILYFTFFKFKTKRFLNLITRIYNRVLIIFNLKKIIRFEDIKDIETASIILSKYLSNNNISFFNTNYKEII